MSDTLQKIISISIRNPKQLFLIDGIGAAVSAIMLGLVLVYFNGYIGLTVSALYVLAFFPVLFALFDFYCFWKKSLKTADSLLLIGIMNSAYCIFSLIMMYFHFKTITILGLIYFIAEILIVIFLSIVEIKTAFKLCPSKKL